MREFMETDNKEIVADVTEDEYESDLRRGLQEDEVMKPGRHKFRRGEFLRRHGITSVPTKVRISADIDLDILNYLRQRALKAGTDSYETELNNILREFIETEKNASVLPLQLEALLADRRFIEAVARQVRAHNSETGK